MWLPAENLSDFRIYLWAIMMRGRYVTFLFMQVNAGGRCLRRSQARIDLPAKVLKLLSFAVVNHVVFLNLSSLITLAVSLEIITG